MSGNFLSSSKLGESMSKKETSGVQMATYAGMPRTTGRSNIGAPLLEYGQQLELRCSAAPMNRASKGWMQQTFWRPQFQSMAVTDELPDALSRQAP
jgi:hypothetical protein